MSKTNKRKLMALGLISSVLGITTIAFQNFTVNESGNAPGKSGNSLSDAISAALKTAEADTTAKQMALNVEPTQIEKSSLKKHRNPMAIVDTTDSLTETNTDWTQKETETRMEVEDSIGAEISD